MQVAWNNFVTYIESCGDNIDMNVDYSKIIDDELAKHNAKNRRNTNYIDFEDKSDAVEFLLMWG
jgi:hypothetical protein